MARTPADVATTETPSATMKRDLQRTTGDSRPPVLSTWEERKLAERIKAGDQRAQERLILANRRLVFRIVRNYKIPGVSLDDLVQEGSVGLIRAAQNFDPSTHAIRFSSYAAFWIRAFIQRALTNDCAQRDTQGGPPTQLETPENELVEQEERGIVHAALWQLNPFEAWVIRERFGLGEWCSDATDSSNLKKKAASHTTAATARRKGATAASRAARPSASYYGRTHKNLSHDCGLSVHRIRLIERAALDKLRAILSPAPARGLSPRDQNCS